MPSLPLVDPPPTTGQLTDNRNAVYDGIESAVPVNDLPDPGRNKPLPAPEDLDNLLRHGVPTETQLSAYKQVIGYQNPDGTFAGNERARTQCFTVDHSCSSIVARNLILGLPIPPKSVFVPPPLQISFSESGIRARLAETPPRRYDGAPCYPAADAELHRPDIEAAKLRMRADQAWAGIAFEEMDILAECEWGKGQTYFPVNFDPNWSAGKTAAEIFWNYDQGTREKAIAQGITGPSA